MPVKAAVAGVAMGVYTALYRDSWLARFFMVFSLIGGILGAAIFTRTGVERIHRPALHLRPRGTAGGVP